jgi:intraflagellar transport protein 122
VIIPYAEWLVSEDRYDDAMLAYRRASRNDLAKQVLEALTFNAVLECRFKDAAYFYWMLSQDNQLPVKLISEYAMKADLYFAYASIHAFVTDPFTTHQPDILFQMSRYLINQLSLPELTLPYGISIASILFTLARQAMSLEAYKLARHVYERLGKLKLPSRLIDDVEIDKLIVQAKPLRDEQLLLPVCFRCGAVNPLLNPGTNKHARGNLIMNTI